MAKFLRIPFRWKTVPLDLPDNIIPSGKPINTARVTAPEPPMVRMKRMKKMKPKAILRPEDNLLRVLSAFLQLRAKRPFLIIVIMTAKICQFDTPRIHYGFRSYSQWIQDKSGTYQKQTHA